MKNRTTITFHSGLDSIGGVIMEVRYNDDRAFFEAGTAYNPGFDMFDGHVKLRKNFISDYLWINELPKINGIYGKEYISEKYPELISAEDFKIDNQAFYITHMHLDHMRMMGMIAPEVKVYLSEPAQKLEKALEEVNRGVESVRGFVFDDIPEESNVGSIHVRKFILNHDSYQDYSFFIETPDLKIHHTGDVFVYGVYRNNILKEIEFLNKNRPDLLMCEGTRFFAAVKPESFKNNKIIPSFEPKDGLITFDRLKERIIETVSSYPGIIIFNFYEREMSDVMLFTEVARKTNRKLIYEPETAHLINRFFGYPVTVMVPDTYKEKPEYLDDILEYNTVITKEQIMNEPQKYLIQNTYPNSLELLDYRNMKALYLHHSGVPLGNYDPKYQNLMNIIKLANMDYNRTYDGEDGYFSPHAETFQILAYINMVNARLTVPCHSGNRKAMEANLTVPYFHAEKGVTYVYDRENNTLEVTDNE
ncbi:MAG: hypothetical protein IIZ74_00510 [Erysipelotrichaceae bacterium]|nr:hypothetical protein [Erysipelotrichaceae bacterium]